MPAQLLLGQVEVDGKTRQQQQAVRPCQGGAVGSPNKKDDQEGAQEQKDQVFGEFTPFDRQRGHDGADSDANTDIDQVAAGYVAQGKLGIAVQGGYEVEKQLRSAGAEGHQRDTDDKGRHILLAGDTGGTRNQEITAFEEQGEPDTDQYNNNQHNHPHGKRPGCPADQGSAGGDATYRVSIRDVNKNRRPFTLTIPQPC